MFSSHHHYHCCCHSTPSDHFPLLVRSIASLDFKYKPFISLSTTSLTCSLNHQSNESSFLKTCPLCMCTWFRPTSEPIEKLSTFNCPNDSTSNGTFYNSGKRRHCCWRFHRLISLVKCLIYFAICGYNKHRTFKCILRDVLTCHFLTE